MASPAYRRAWESRAGPGGRRAAWGGGGGLTPSALTVRGVHELAREVNDGDRNLGTKGWSKRRPIGRCHQRGASGLHECARRAAVPIDTIRVDRYDFQEQSLASPWIDGERCWGIDVRGENRREERQATERRS